MYMKNIGCDRGYSDQRVRERIKLINGAMAKMAILAMVGADCSFSRSFMASARGCGIPEMDTLFGPLRSWI